jgi:hypothetical protein
MGCNAKAHGQWEWAAQENPEYSDLSQGFAIVQPLPF